MRRVFCLAVLLVFLTSSLTVNAQSAKPITAGELNNFVFSCGYLVKAKNNNGNKIIVVVGEYHKFPDVQKDVECILKQLLATYNNIAFLGKEGIDYDSGTQYSSLIPKLNLGIPLIGIEGTSWKNDYDLIDKIDDRHKELSKKKMEIGLTPEEQIEYEYVTNQSYEIIVRKRSWEWADNLKDFMDKTQKSVGIINVGFSHFYTLQERFDHYSISYLMILPNAASSYVSCEAYWQKKKPNSSISPKDACDDKNIKPFWD